MSGITFAIDANQFTGVFQAALQVVAKYLDQAFARMVGPLKVAAGELVEESVRASPEYQSLLSGELRHELGVVDGAAAMQEVFAAIAEAIIVTHDPVGVAGQDLTGGLRVGILRSDLRDALSAASGTFRSEGGNVPWLKWLLTGGGEVLLAGFQYIPAERRGSRTGQGVMAQIKSDGRGHPWKLSQFQGTESDNFLSRALADAGDKMVQIIVEALRVAL